MPNRNPYLSSSHYAYNWKINTEQSFNSRHEINALAIEYARLEDGPEKERLLLQIIEAFHSYLCKYHTMIHRGHLPSMRSPAGKEATKMLTTLIKEGQPINRQTLLATCRTMHLAFKQNTADDIYDTLAMCLIRAVRKYDPFYTDKLRKVYDVIAKGFIRRKKDGGLFTVEEVSQTVGTDCRSYVRKLSKYKVLESITGPKKKVLGYRRGPKWPAEPKFFESGPIGFVYFLPMYFRWYLHEYISESMQDLESKEGVLQLGHGLDENVHPGDSRADNIPDAQGAFVSCYGRRLQADMNLAHAQFDISNLDMNWVEHTDDFLFRCLTRKERYILYLVFEEKYKWVQIASELDTDVRLIRKEFNDIMTYLQGRARPPKHALRSA